MDKSLQAAWYDQPENQIEEFLRFLDSQLPGTGEAYFSSTEEQFLNAIDKSLNAAVERIERTARFLTNRNELELSTTLCNMMSRAAIRCYSEAYSNGHVDITIEHHTLPMKYLGECKIWNGCIRHFEGCEQLLSRYSSGREVGGFVLEFFNVPGLYEKMKLLQERIADEKPCELAQNPTEHEIIKGGFRTMHRHFTGAVLALLHLGCNVFHPESLR